MSRGALYTDGSGCYSKSEYSITAGHHDSSSSTTIDVNSGTSSSEFIVYSPMLGALREFMLAMLIYVGAFECDSVLKISISVLLAPSLNAL